MLFLISAESNHWLSRASIEKWGPNESDPNVSDVRTARPLDRMSRHWFERRVALQRSQGTQPLPHASGRKIQEDTRLPGERAASGMNQVNRKRLQLEVRQDDSQ